MRKNFLTAILSILLITTGFSQDQPIISPQQMQDWLGHHGIQLGSITDKILLESKLKNEGIFASAHIFIAYIHMYNMGTVVDENGTPEYAEALQACKNDIGDLACDLATLGPIPILSQMCLFRTIVDLSSSILILLINNEIDKLAVNAQIHYYIGWRKQGEADPFHDFDVAASAGDGYLWDPYHQSQSFRIIPNSIETYTPDFIEELAQNYYENFCLLQNEIEKESGETAQLVADLLMPYVEAYNGYQSGDRVKILRIHGDPNDMIVIANKGDYNMTNVRLINKRPVIGDQYSETVDIPAGENRSLFVDFSFDDIDDVEFDIWAGHIERSFQELVVPLISLMNYNFTSSPSYAPQTVVFHAGPVPVPANEDDYAYSWNFGDGESSTQKNLSHIYNKPGRYHVKLIVWDRDQYTDSMEKEVVVENPVICAYPLTADQEGLAPLTVQFNASASQSLNGKTLSCSWNFGDGNTGNGEVVIHVYQQSGTFDAQCIAQDENGVRDTSYQSIHVYAPFSLIADFTASPTSGDNPLTVQFNDLSSAENTTITSWKWDFDNDGKLDSYAQNPTYVYLYMGTYSVRLWVSDGNIIEHKMIENYITVGSSTPPTHVTALEYFFDDDPGLGNGITIPCTPSGFVNIQKNIDVGGLSFGAHKIYIRAMDENNNWGIAQAKTVVIQKSDKRTPTPNVANVEYFWDDDPGAGSGAIIPISPDTLFNKQCNINVIGMAFGSHKLYVRARDGRGDWGIPQAVSVLVQSDSTAILQPQVTHVEYFFDDDPGFGMGMPLSIVPGDSFLFQNKLSFPSISSGLHKLYMRAKDSRGRWGIPQAKSVLFQPLPASDSTQLITGIEYFYDHDPGYGKAFAMSIPPVIAKDATLNFSIPGLDVGKHTLYVRARAGGNLWGIAQADTFSVKADPISTVTLTYSFPQMGWYMVSLPIVPSDSTVTNLFPQALGGMAFSWDPSSNSYIPVNKMQLKTGYWLAISNSSTVQVTGMPLINYIMHFAGQGWYMIGSVMGSTDFTSPNDNPDGQVLSPAFGWDPVAESYLPTTMLNEKQSYWAAVFGACDLTVGGNGGMSKSLADMDWELFRKKYGNTPPLPPSIDWENKTIAKIPESYGLSQNYPNPFSAGGGSAFGGNPETTIRYQMPDAGFVRLVVYNTMGRVVRHLVDGNRPAGYHQAVWDGRDEQGLSLGSGMYLVRMEAGGFSCLRKVIMMR
jgi:PKD repeat protein